MKGSYLVMLLTNMAIMFYLMGKMRIGVLKSFYLMRMRDMLALIGTQESSFLLG